MTFCLSIYVAYCELHTDILDVSVLIILTALFVRYYTATITLLELISVSLLVHYTKHIYRCSEWILSQVATIHAIRLLPVIANLYAKETH